MLRNHPATEPSRHDKPPKASSRKRKQSTARSILSPVDPAKVSKAPSKRRGPHQKMSVPYDTSQEAEKTTPNSSTPESRSKQAFKVKDPMPASLRPIHSLRVSNKDVKLIRTSVDRPEISILIKPITSGGTKTFTDLYFVIGAVVEATPAGLRPLCSIPKTIIYFESKVIMSSALAAVRQWLNGRGYIIRLLPSSQILLSLRSLARGGGRLIGGGSGRKRS